MASVAIAHLNEETRRRVGDALRARGLQVYATADFAGALKAGQQSRLCAILVDPELLRREPLDVRPRIKKAAGYQVPLIALTHVATGELREILRSHGANLVPKPLDDLVPLADTLEMVARKLDESNMLGSMKEINRPVSESRMTRPGRILVVDDESAFRNFVVEALRDEGYEVHGMPSAEDALAYLEKKEIDLVVSDINMPGMDGFELKQQIDNWSRRAVPFIAMTADSSRENEGNADAVGAIAFVGKPIRDLNEFFRLVRSALGARVPGR